MRAEADADLVAGVRAGDEAVFARLLQDWSGSMLMLARSFVSTPASAEEVVQDTWLAVIDGIDRFEGRSSFRTWVYRILVNTAKRRGARESRTVPWSMLPGEEDLGPSVEPSRFRGADDPWAGGWRAFPEPWASPSEGGALAAEVRRELRAALDTLPERQRVVILLRDVLGHDAAEVCQMLDVSAGNQRVLLHRARSAVRAQVAPYLEQDEAG